MLKVSTHNPHNHPPPHPQHGWPSLAVTQTEFDAIPLEPNIKNEFQLEVVPDVIGPEEDEETRTKEGDTDTETEYTENWNINYYVQNKR